MNSKVLQGDVLPVVMAGSILVLVQALSEWDVFEVDGSGGLFYCPR